MTYLDRLRIFNRANMQPSTGANDYPFPFLSEKLNGRESMGREEIPSSVKNRGCTTLGMPLTAHNRLDIKRACCSGKLQVTARGSPHPNRLRPHRHFSGINSWAATGAVSLPEQRDLWYSCGNVEQVIYRRHDRFCAGGWR